MEQIKFSEALDAFIDAKCCCDNPDYEGLNLPDRKALRKQVSIEYDKAASDLDRFVLPTGNPVFKEINHHV
jgi:hypothetical protein